MHVQLNKLFSLTQHLGCLPKVGYIKTIPSTDVHMIEIHFSHSWEFCVINPKNMKNKRLLKTADINILSKKVSNKGEKSYVIGKLISIFVSVPSLFFP